MTMWQDIVIWAAQATLIIVRVLEIPFRGGD